MRSPSLLAHLQAVLLLPVMVTIGIPWLIYVPDQWPALNTWVVKGMGGLLAGAGLVFGINTLYFMAIEEPDLRQRFGTDYIHFWYIDESWR